MDYPDFQKYIKGCYGEAVVRSHLIRIPGAVVYSNVKIPGDKGDIDHLVITDYGVFAIETKNWDAWVHVRDDEWSYIKRKGQRKQVPSVSKRIRKRARAVNKYIERKLGIKNQYVTPVIALKNRFNKRNINGCSVEVLSPSDLPAYIQSRGFRQKIDPRIKGVMVG